MISDIQKLVHQAWDAFVPPSARLLTVMLIIYMIAGYEPFRWAAAFFKPLHNTLSSPVVIKQLKDLGLTSLTPFIVVLLITVLLYCSDRLILGAARLLPIGFGYKGSPWRWAPSSLIQQVWAWYPHISSAEHLRTAVDDLIARARLEGKGEVLSQVYREEERLNGLLRQWSFLKTCFMLTLVLWGFAGYMKPPIAISGSGIRWVAGMLLSVSVFNLLSQKSATRNAFTHRLYAASVILEMGKDEPPHLDAGRRVFISSQTSAVIESRLSWRVSFLPWEWLCSILPRDLRIPGRKARAA